MRFVASRGAACLHPFNALPYDFFEGGAVGRQETLKICCRLIDCCDEIWVFGISEGVLIELEYAGTTKPILSFIQDFDPEWRHFYDHYKKSHPKVLTTLRHD